MTTATRVTHTPGPWTEDGFRTIVGADRTVVATINRTGQVGHAHLTENANRRLIAAAPQLLDVCIEAVEQITDHIEAADLADDDNHPLAGLREQLRAAIAKAEGR